LFPFLVHADITPKEKFDVTLFCYDTDSLFSALRKDFDERPFFVGKANDVASSTMSFWVSKKGDTWSIIATIDDMSCVVGSGTNLQLLKLGKTI
jgi:hypothetical protein